MIYSKGNVLLLIFESIIVIKYYQEGISYFLFQN